MRPCEHCSNPDKDNWLRRCRYSWYLPNSEGWKRSGADPPCAWDAYVERQRPRERRGCVFSFIILAVLAGLSLAFILL